MEIELENGLKLLVQPVSQPAIDELIDDLGGYPYQLRLSEMSTEAVTAHFRAMPPDKLKAYNDTLRRQSLYCLGFGVATDPPEDAITLLQHLGKDSPIPQIRRAHWLLYVAGITRADKVNIIGAVLALTRISDGR
jgi:hypothetical protein